MYSLICRICLITSKGRGMVILKTIFHSTLTAIITSMLFISGSFAQEEESFLINNYCIGNVCIGDTVNTIKEKYSDYIIKPNDSNTGYYIFDKLGNFLIEFSTKKRIDNNNNPVRYIMTSNPNYTFEPGEISLETKVSELIKEYGNPSYESGPNGYLVHFQDWPIKQQTSYKNYQINMLVGVYNPKLSDLFKYSGNINETAEIKLLKSYPELTILNTIEIFCDHYKNGNPLP